MQIAEMICAKETGGLSLGTWLEHQESNILGRFTIRRRKGYGGTGVMCRGNQRGPIFVRDADREASLITLGEGCEQSGWRVQAYVLMPNHYHCLLETPAGNWVARMSPRAGSKNVPP